jgi:spore coat protein U-like protein
MRMRFALLIAAGILLAAPLAARAQAITCTASNTTVNFGAYDVISGATLDSAGSFTVTCVTAQNGPTRNVTYSVGLAGSPARQLAPPAGADRLTYEVYVDASRTQPWGDGTGGTFVISGTLGVPGAQKGGTATSAPHNYYARITPGGQDVSAASPGPPPTTYQQTLTVTTTCTPGC